MNQTATFLAAITPTSREMILSSIAVHYGISPQEAYAEVTDQDAEELLDYLVEPARSATSILMRRHGFR